MSQKIYTIFEFIEAGCTQFEHPTIGIALYTYMGGRICGDCPKVNNCAPLRKLQAGNSSRLLDKALPQNNGGETVRQEAARRGIGIKEVRRQRRDKQLQDDS